MSTEERPVPAAWTRGPDAPAASAGLAAMILAQAASRPHEPAVVQGDVLLTYADLARRAWGLAHTLRAHGVGPEDRVAICLRRRPPLAVAVLGVLLAGGAYVPTAPDDPEQRRALVLADAGVAIGVADAAGAAALAGRVPVVLDPDTDTDTDPDTEPGGGEGGWPPPGRGQAAYVLYTSGSTGRPKGVVVEHGALADFAASVAAPAGIGPATRALAFAALGFDVSVLDLLVPLAHGACVVLAGDADRTDPVRLTRLCHRHGVTWAAVPPALLALLEPDELPALRRVVTAGEAPAPAQAARWSDPPHRTFANWYGPTEAVVVAAGGDVEGAWATPLPLGGPLPGRTAYVLDRSGAEVPVGAPGELYLGGLGLARGYLGSPGLTARRFVPDPRSPVPGARMYRTGDLVRWQSDGTLLFLGRVDRQVKIRGQRVELGEIEAVLQAHPRVGGAIVDAVTDRGATHLVAYLVPASAPELAELADHCGASLSPAMVPSRVHRLDAFPLNASAKIDLAALRRLDAPPRGRSGGPRLDGPVGAAWRHAFGHDPAPDEDFFAAGGHSLTAMRLVAQLRAVTGRDVGVEDVLRARTAAGIAALLTRAPALATEAAAAPAGLTPAQRRLWFIDRLAPAAAAYNVTMALRIDGPLDVAALRAALGAVADRHEALRWRITSIGGRPGVEIDPPGRPAELPVEDLTALAGAALERACRERLDAAAARPFDTAAGPLWRAHLIRTAPGTHRLGVVVHHAVFDGWSQSLYLRDLGHAYRRAIHSGPVPPPAPGFSAYARWRAERARRHGPADLDWAAEHFGGEPAVPELPRDRPRPPVQAFDGAAVTARVPDPLARAAAGLARACAATPAAVLLAAFAVQLRRLTGHADLVVGVPVADRREARFAEVIGLLLDTVPVRLRVADPEPFTALVAACHEELLLALTHREAELDALVDRLGTPRRPGRNPLVNVLFNVLNTPPLRLELPGAVVSEETPGLAGSPFDATLYAQPGEDDRLDLRLVFRTDLFDRDRMATLLADLIGLLGQLVADPHAPVAAAGAGAPGPTGALRRSTAPPIGIVESIVEVCAAAPAAVAVREADRAVSRAELLARAAAVARAVRARPPGSRVAILAERCGCLPSALLGVLAGGARWVVLDQSAPTALLERQLDAVGAGAALSCPDSVLPARIRDALRARGVHPLDVAWTGASTAIAVAPAAERGYLTLTSGTTGTPLAVATGEEPLAHFLGWYPRAFGLGPADRFALLSGLGHDPLLRDILTPLVLGAELCVPPPHTARDPQRLAAWLRESAVTVLHATPPLIRLLAAARDLPGRPLPALRLVVSGGDQLTLADAALVRRFAPGARLVNAYGTTETPQIHAWHEVQWSTVEHYDWEPGRPVPVGTAAPGSEVLVLDPCGRPAAVGELGEVVVRGPYLAEGYATDGGPTDRFSTVDGVRQFRTGDLGRRDAAGAVTLAGRADDQVSIRGHRVELGEVEAALLAHPDVAAGVVTVATDAGETVLIGHVVPAHPDARVDGLRAHLRGALPGHAVPAAIALVAEIPLTPNGKPDRAALAAAGRPAEPPPPSVEPARAGTERLIIDAWRAVLGVRVGATENFFDAGGHSLAIVEVASRLADALDRPVEVVTLFRYPTARSLAAFLDHAAQDPALDRVAQQIADRRARTRARQRGGAGPAAGAIGAG